ncbi:MAG: phosphoribosylaminoimidazolesuccinocarboxamide synthase [Clostridiales bacterium]|jgi:phosphoribosylaminoimidazole-succinocarboxamide synthase|nr:phosphoribosylaminoimidazolesuccinocarboxamide synthase [Clostridiales bacterium]
MLIKDTDFIDLPVFCKGKVRNVYDLGDSLLMIVTDRISAFDVVFDELIPDKGKVLSSISAFWFDFTRDVIGNHVITTDVSEYPMGLDKFKDELQGRSMLVKKVDMLPAECIVRGYLEGSALKEYKKSGTVGGIKMPEGMVQGDKLPEPLFTPSTKEESGHDINITFEQLVDLIGEEDATALRDASLALYKKVSEFALTKGLILADTKFEFGKLDGKLVVADEMFTPDSSRFWDLEDYQPGRAQKSFDKQYLREWLETLDWDKTYPAPTLPEEIISKTAEKYRECYSRLTGKEI